MCMFIDPQDTFLSDPRGTSGTRVFFLLFEQLSFGETRTRSKIGATPNAKAETRAYGIKKTEKSQLSRGSYCVSLKTFLGLASATGVVDVLQPSS